MAVAALLVLLVPFGAVLAEVPKPGTDVTRAAGSVEITVDGIGTGYVRLIGDVTIVRHPPDPGGPPPDDEIPIEIVSLNLTGFSPVFGRVGVTPCITMASTGFTRRAVGVESPADSFFDVWFDITLPDLGLDLTQGAYFRINARTTAVPFFDVFTGMFSQMVPLMDEATGMPMGALTHVALDPNPRVDILATDARLDWTIGALGGPDTVPLGGRSIVVASESFNPPAPITLPEFNTEIIAMDLTGFSPRWGDTVFMERMQTHSPGRVKALGPGPIGPSQFPADSLFDVFFDIQTSFFDVFCQDPLTGKAMIDAWPPFGAPYVPPNPCTLFDRGSGQPMGTLDSFSWIWTQPMGACVDADGDGVDAPPCGTDCDDNDPNNHPGNLEACADGRDNNCNQLIDCSDPLCLGRPCDDGDPCTQDDRCVQGPGGANACQGAPVNCDDANPCTADSCDPASRACLHVPTTCDDGNACTSDSCDPLTGQCVYTPLTCDDENACTENDRCVQITGGGTTCQGDPVDCDDNNPCTTDICNPMSGCMPHLHGCFEEFDLCTIDSCQQQACTVPDNGGGTADLPAQCPYDAQGRITTVHADGTISHIADVRLLSFTCPPATPAVCSFPSPVPGVDCSQPGGTLAGEEACADAVMTLRFTHYNPMTGVAYNRIIDLPVSLEMHAAPRTPGDPVQSFATDLFRLFGQISMDPDFDLLRITAGTDFGMPSPGHTTLIQAGGDWGVDSFFDITLRIDSVLAPGSQLQAPNGSQDWTVRFRTGGGCVHTPVVCDDGNPCTTDSCDPATGECKFVPAPGAPCDDGELCTEGDRCVPDPIGGITCQGAPVDCDDNDPCTADRCDPLTGQCLHVPVDCDDLDPCTLDRCNPLTGACEHLPVICNDGNQCTADSCDPATGACKFAPTPGALCDDGNDCTQDDRCTPDATGGISCLGTPVNCDDQDPCTQDSCNPSGCIVPDNGTGTATLPPGGCGYATQNDLRIINGLPVGTTIDIPALHRNFSCPASSGVCSFALPIPGVDCDQAGGSLGGEEQCADSILELHLMGTGTLLGFNRIINLPVSLETHTAPRTPGDPVQSFNTDMFRLFGAIVNPADGDPDFDLLRLVAGTDFSMPGPGHTTLTQQGGNWAVDSFFDITYRIDFVGKPGGTLSGMSGSTTGTARFRTAPGGCVHVPVSCDDQDPCTTDRCNPVTGACEHLPVICNDGNQCTADSCDPATGLCVHVLNTCDDGDVCTQDACDPATGACEHRPLTVLEPDPILFRDQVTISWMATPDATHWNTYRGSIPMALLGSRLPASVYDQVCYESDDAGGDGPTTAVDVGNPALGTAFYYLTSGESACGESFIGHPSSPPGAAIPNTMSCPTPP